MKNYKVSLERCASSVDTLEVKSELKEKEWLKENSQVLKTDNKTNKIIIDCVLLLMKRL